MLKKLFGRAAASPENPEGIPAPGEEVSLRKRTGGPKSNAAKARAKLRRLRKKSRS